MAMSSPTPTKKTVSKQMTFPEALLEVIDGYKITKLEWANPSEYVFLHDGFLCIHHSGSDNKTFNRLLVSEGDLIGKDWMVIKEESYDKN